VTMSVELIKWLAREKENEENYKIPLHNFRARSKLVW
jgi:hypothetical protein